MVKGGSTRVSRSPSSLLEIYSIDNGTKREGIYLGFFTENSKKKDGCTQMEIFGIPSLQE